ncbi:MAG: zinc ribbon domain-containing protein [Armatimonadota bacterium]|nr:zinc ribbon domain-containing protein [Armatimonadota bacterium]MDR7471922.1 zinc ribbon domain-containing protein [Armatimonadota bacterium]
MPIYEFRCRRCRRKSSVFVLSYKEPFTHTCPHCGSADLTRIMSRFATVRSEEDRLESLADSADLGDVNENDPRSVARWMKRMGKEFGDELGEDFEEAIDEALAEESKSPEEKADTEDFE